MRKEVNLDEDVISSLQLLADKKKWSLKKYMEHVLELYSKRATVVVAKYEKAVRKKAKMK